MCKSKNTIIVSIHDLRGKTNEPPQEIQSTLRSIGAKAIVITPYNNLPSRKFCKNLLWIYLTNLSEIKGFSFLLPLVFFLKCMEIHRQVRKIWSEYDRIFAYDKLSALTARRAAKSNLPLIMLSHYGGDPYLSYQYRFNTVSSRTGFWLMQRIIFTFMTRSYPQSLPTS